MRLRILLLMLTMFVVVGVPITHAQPPVFPIQVIGQQAGSCSNPAVCNDIIGVNSGAAAGSTFTQDSNGNLIALFACSNFSNCGGNSHFGFLAWSNDGGKTWSNCGFGSGVCSGTPQTTHAMQNQGSTCIHAGAIYVSGSTVDVAYQQTTLNTQANFYVDRFQITYSGNSITSISNGGPLTTVVATDQSSSGLSCVQQILPTPNGGGEIMIFAVEENSGPLYMFRTGVTTSAFKDLSGTASAISSTITSQNDGSNSCSQFQPTTGDIWNFDVYDRTGGTVFVNQYPYNSGTGNWGAVTSHSLGGNNGVPLLTKSAACTADSVDKIVFFSWFRCLTSGGAICATGAPVGGNVCTFQLWEATTSSSSAIPTQLATLTDTGACHETQNNSQSGGGGSLTFVNGQLFLTGVDDNLFGTGCSSEGGSDDTKCQQLFLAKYTISGNSWGSITQYPGNPSAVIGEAAFSGNPLNLLYSTCNNYIGTTNGNDGACGVATGNSLFFDPILPPPPPTLCSTSYSGAIVGAEALIVIMAIMMAQSIGQAFARSTNRQMKIYMQIIIAVSLAIFISVLILGQLPAGIGAGC